MRTSHAPGYQTVSWRDGYRVIRKGGRYMVFPRASFSEMMGWHGASDALVEIWNGMPFFSPLWARRPHVIWLHHVHDTMWEMTLPPRLARLGRNVEYRVAPPIYRRTQIVTLSESSKRELVQKLHFKAKRIHVVPPGIEERFSPGGEKSPVPLVVAVGRLVPVKRFGVLVDALCDIKARHPALQAIIMGDGYEREMLEAQVHTRDATSWISLPGRVDDATLIDAYRRAWVVASTSAHEGWGMTITEAAACGTPSVATRIAGHEDAVVARRIGTARRRRARCRRRARSGARRRRAARPAHRRRGRPRRRVHLGRDRVRHAPGAGRRDDQTTRAARRVTRSSASVDERGSDTSRWRSLAYVPPLLTQPGKVAADTKQYLYLDPSRLLGRARVDVGPEHRARHRHPPEHRLPVPDGAVLLADGGAARPRLGRAAVVARHLVLCAGLGVLYLLRTLGVRGPGVAVAALAYMFSPYSLDYAARISVLLMPWAALGWMIALTIKALRDGRVALSRDVRARRAARRRGERDRARSSRASVRCCGSIYACVTRQVDVRRAVARHREDRWSHAPDVAVVDRGTLGPGQLRTRHPQVHRDGQGGRADVDPERGAARARVLVLLRPGSRRPVDRGVGRLHAAHLRHPGRLRPRRARAGWRRDHAVASPRVLPRAGVRGRGDRRRRVPVRQPDPARVAVQGVREQLDGGSRAAQHRARDPARHARPRDPARHRV